MALAPGRQFLRSLSGIALFPGMSESPFPFRAAWLKKIENILGICIFMILLGVKGATEKVFLYFM